MYFNRHTRCTWHVLKIHDSDIELIIANNSIFDITSTNLAAQIPSTMKANSPKTKFNFVIDEFFARAHYFLNIWNFLSTP